MQSIPKTRLPDHSIFLLTQGYPHLINLFRKHNTRILQTRFAFQKVICLGGEDGAKIFYDNEKFKRENVAPTRLKDTLFGHGGVHGMDGQSHHHRKSMYMNAMTPKNIQRLNEIYIEEWKQAIRGFALAQNINLFKESSKIIFKAIYRWAGIPFDCNEVNQRASEIIAMIDAFGGLIKRHRKGKKARVSHEAWLMNKIEEIREGKISLNEEMPAHSVAFHIDENGTLLDLHTASVAMSNMTRPALAISYFVVYQALAMDSNEEVLKKLRTDDPQYLTNFVNEVRRYYPFVPMLGARAKTDFEYNGYQINKGQLTLLDIYGILHDETIWEEPEKFNPDRFANQKISPYTLLPQGGGEFDVGHRCAGEWITIEMLKISAKALSQWMKFDINSRDKNFSLTRFPSFPANGLQINNIQNSIGENKPKTVNQIKATP